MRIFITSVQKEFAAERKALAEYLSGDPLLRRFFETVRRPATGPATQSGTQSGPGQDQGGQLESRLESRLESSLAAKVVLAIRPQPLGKAAIAPILGHKTVSGEIHKQIKRMVDDGLIEPTIPEKPTSRLQKYRLTAKGQALLAELEKPGGNA